MTAIADIPIFPLRTVLYPDGQLPLRIFEQRYVDMTKACISSDGAFGVCLILDGSEAGVPAVPHRVGCSARIAQWEVPSPGLFNLVARGESVFRIHQRRTMPDGLIRAEVEYEPAAAPTALPEAYCGLAQILEEVIRQVGAQVFSTPLRLDDAAWVCHRLAEVLPLPLAARQHLLETRDPEAKTELVAEMLRTIARQEPDASGD